MTWLDTPGAFENQVNRSVFKGNLPHFRSSRLKAVVAAMQAAERDPSEENLRNVAPPLFQWRRSDPNEFNARFGEQRYDQLMSELLEKRRRQKFGIPLVIDPPSHPSWEPDLWNDNGTTQLSTNCYAYACNDRLGHREATFGLNGRGELNLTGLYTPQPGHMARQVGLGGASGPTGTAEQRAAVSAWIQSEQAQRRPGLTPSDVRFQVMMDDRIRRAKLTPFLLSPGQDPVNVPGYYLVALVVCGVDYHWLRQDEDSYWSHKGGITEVKCVDDDGELIWDPRHAKFRRPPYRFECFYQVPAGGVKTWHLGDLGIGAFLREGVVNP
jgi:hypothetical protein